jgi:hypothetical protein
MDVTGTEGPVTSRASRASGGSVAPIRARSREKPAGAHRPKRRSTTDALDWSLYLGTAAALAIGWHLRGEQYIVAEKGLGYALGIGGAGAMLALLLYPIRKRLGLRGLGSVKAWFRTHIMLGVVGPTLVLFHANFGTGSFNDNVALYSMLVVALSGFMGRHLYARIHHGLYGRKATLEELRVSLEDNRRHIASCIVEALDSKLLAVEEEVLRPPRNVVASALLPLWLAVKTRWQGFALRRFARRSLRRRAASSRLVAEHRARLEKTVCRHISNRLQAVRSVAEFRFYERLFSLWHTIHYPLFLVLVVATTLHVVAVHFY